MIISFPSNNKNKFFRKERQIIAEATVNINGFQNFHFKNIRILNNNSN